jgi:hypothetical protein
LKKIESVEEILTITSFNREVKLYVEEEWVWRRLCKNGFGGNVIFAVSWKRTYLHKSRAIWDEVLEAVETQAKNRKLGDLLLPFLVRKQFWKVATNFRKNGRTTPVSDDLKEIEWYLDETVKHRG